MLSGQWLVDRREMWGWSGNRKADPSAALRDDGIRESWVLQGVLSIYFDVVV
ncbi:MAG: hypothetical protein JWO20_2484 [Candidatus Angelobacter sp.]|nr:hypothetical protein [Candidatus Angelobacter sp.]